MIIFCLHHYYFDVYKKKFMGGSFWAVIADDILEHITDYKGMFSALEIGKLEIVQ